MANLDSYLNSPLGKILNAKPSNGFVMPSPQPVASRAPTVPNRPPAVGNYNLASSASSPVSSGSVGSSSAPQRNWQDFFSSYYDPIKTQVEAHTNQLIEQAQGDFDFVAKWIESEYKKAVGSDDKQTQQFLESVANDLEAKVGRIQFDYETGKYRKEEDISTVEDTRSKLLSRLDQDQQMETKNLLRETREGRQNLGEGLNERGLINGSMKEGLVGEEFRDYDEEVNDRFTALERAFGRDREDVNLEADLGVRGLNRDIEDITTDARRGIVDETDNRNMETERAKRERDKLVSEANRIKDEELMRAKQQANSQANANIKTYG